MDKTPRNQARVHAVKRYRRSTMLAVLVVLLSLTATVWAWRANQKHAWERAKTRFDQEVQRTRLSMLSRLEVYEDGLYGTRSLFEANQVVTRQMFHDYVGHLRLEERYPGIQGIGFAQYIPASDLQAHIAAVRKGGFPDYTVKPPGARPEYTSIIYLEPFDWRNQRAFGYDMFSEPTRRAAMEYARDSGGTSLSGKVRLVQETETDVQSGVLMYLPLYRKGAPRATVAERRRALLGYIYSPFRVRNLAGEIFQEHDPLAYFEIFSGKTTSPNARIFRAEQLNEQSSPAALTELSEVNFGGQTWTFRFVATPGFDRAVEDGTNHFILPAGLFITILLFGLTLSLAQTERRALRLADLITARLRESENRIRAITETATDAIISVDGTGRIVYFNPAAERIFGYTVNNVIGQSVAMLMPDRFKPADADAIERFLRTRTAELVGRNLEWVARRVDGTELPVNASISTWEANGTFFTGIVRDVTERKRAEEEILKLNEELTDALYRSEKLAITGRLVATVAHEINNPLEALMNLLFVLQSQPSIDAQASEFLRLAQDQVAVLSNVTRQTLAPYREAEFPVVTNLAELLDDVLAVFRPKFMAARIDVRRKYPNSVFVTIYPSELRQVFTNLIANAIDAMQEGGRLTIAMSAESDSVAITVEDTGHGIPDDQLVRIYEPFYTTKPGKGTGVGLWVVKTILEKVGGTIDIQTSTNHNNHGTKFTIVLPTTVEETEPVASA